MNHHLSGSRNFRQNYYAKKKKIKNQERNIDTPSCHKQQLQARYKQEDPMDKLSLPAQKTK